MKGRARGLVAVCIGLGLAVRLAILLRPVEVLVHRYLADDVFYYLSVAFHVAEGEGSTVDGGITYTNGYNPLLMGMLAASFWLGASKVLAIRIALLIEAVGIAVAAALGAQVCIDRQAPRAAVLTAGLVSFSAFFLWPTLTGFETGLATGTLFVALYLHDRAARPEWIGMGCGLAFLARVDALALFAVVVVLQLRRDQVRVATRTAVGFLVVALPFVAWSWQRFGLFLPGSALHKIQPRGVASIVGSFRVILTALPELVLPHRLLDVLPGVACWAVAGVVLALALAGARRLGWSRALVALAMVASYVALSDGFEQGALRRYLFTVWVLSVMSVAVTIDQHACQRRLWPKLPGSSLATALCGVILSAHLVDAGLLLRWDRATDPRPTYVGACHDLAPVLDALLAPDERVASFDSGSLGYSSPRPVINLDGLVNDDIRGVQGACHDEPYEACLARYLHEKRVTVLVGGTAFGWTRVFSGWSSWTELYRSPPLEDGSRLVVLRVPQ